jgi:methylenetetrahydrofolate dehydrogenase (NADP+)/methenyltetrahydrofolate cyclohydrolase
MTTIDGKKVSEAIANELTSEIAILKQNGVTPTLVIIQVGSNPASDVYVRNKLRLSERLGAKTIIKKLEPTITQTQLHHIIKELNSDDSVNGILVQLPIPAHLNETLVIEEINPNKDVDCFHLANVGKL